MPGPLTRASAGPRRLTAAQEVAGRLALPGGRPRGVLLQDLDGAAGWECYGSGDQTILLLPTWTLAHSRVCEAQVAYFARHFRVVCFGPRGNGRSDRPQDPAAYAEAELAQDARDVMDACAVDKATCVSLSTGAQRGMLLAAEHPERVAGLVFVGACSR